MIGLNFHDQSRIGMSHAFALQPKTQQEQTATCKAKTVVEAGQVKLLSRY